jgi:hypothetical protein
MHALKNKLTLLAVASALATLVGCGGDRNNYLNVSGVAATGLAITDAAVSVQCVSGTGTATTNGNGRYAVTITNGEAPCLVTLEKDKVIYRSITSNIANDSAIANVTPISEAIINGLIAANKGATSALDLVTKPEFKPTTAQLNAVVKAVITQINIALEELGEEPLPLDIDLLGKSDFVAATATTASTDILDLALDILSAKDGTFPAELSEAITQASTAAVNNTPITPPTGATGGTGASGVN